MLRASLTASSTGMCAIVRAAAETLTVTVLTQHLRPRRRHLDRASVRSQATDVSDAL